MCHVTRNVTLTTPASVEATPAIIGSIRGSKSTPSRISPFRRIAKTAKVNLNKYWGLLSQRQPKSAKVASPVPSVFEADFSTEMEENHINEMLEALANAEEQNSINSQIESESSPDAPRRAFCRQRAILSSSYQSFSSHGSSSYQMDWQSQDSLYY